MSKKDPLDPKEVTTTRFEISEDELEARMQRQKEIRIEPVQKAVRILEAALDIVMKSLGIDVDQEPETVKMQQEAMGITIWEHTEETQPQLNGFFIHIGYDRFIPYAWVGGAYLDSEGKCFCDIQWFQSDRLSEIGGSKLIQ